MHRLEHLPLGQRQPRRLRHFAQGIELHGAWLFMHTKELRRLARNKLFCGTNIGKHHELLDHTVRIKPLGIINRNNLALVIQHNLALWQIKLKRLAHSPRRPKRIVSLV